MSLRPSSVQPPPQTRVRGLLVGLLVLLIIGVIFFRGSGDGPDEGIPSAVETTTTVGGASDTTVVPTTQPPDQGGDGAPVADLDELQGVTLDLIYDGFRQPTNLTAPADDDRLFVAQRVGVIRILDENRELVDPAYLDITDRVLAGGIEQGLLGLAFHPNYAENQKFYVYYTDKEGNRQLSEFTATVADPDRANSDSERVLWELPQPPDATDIRHYGGALNFGPDGYLWFTSGDGANARTQGQDPNTMYAALMRIDVDNGDPYAIPESNPFVSGGGAAEVFAYGLRNPWRFSVDSVDRMVYIADVGQGDQEEVNVVSIDQGGYNFGWSDMEGTRCFHVQDCDAADYTAPVLTYDHPEGLSITGGHVYRGAEIPELWGTYFYADWVTAFIRSFDFVDGSVTNETDWTLDLGGPVGQPNSFGIDGHGELYLMTHGGQVYKFTAVR